MRDFDYTDAVEFLALFYEHTEHAVELRSLSNDGSESARPRFTRDPDVVIDHCRRWDEPGRGLFMAMATRKNGSHTGKREDLAELIVLWVDIDCYKLGISKDEAVAALRLCPRRPSVIVDSGGGVHGYWLLRETLDARLPAEGIDEVKEAVDAALKQLAGVFAGDMIVCQISAVMRLPGTHNTKTDELRPVHVLEASWERHEFGDIVEMLDQLRPLLRAPVAAEKASETNPYLEAAKRFGLKAPIDIRARLAEMAYLGGEKGIHWTQLQVSASLVQQGLEDDDIVNLLLSESRRVAYPYGEKWNWKREERNLRRMIADWRAKLAKEPKPAPERPRGPAKVFQLRGGGPREAEERDAVSDAGEPAAAPELSGFPLNDIGNASRLIIHHGAALRYVVGIGWHVWDGRRYKVDPGIIDARKLAHETVRAMLLLAFDLRSTTDQQAKFKKESIKFAISSGNSAKISGMLEQAEPHLAADADDLDKDPMLLNCLNGTLNLRTMHIEQHAQSDLLTKLCDTGYDETTECPIWDKFISEIFDADIELIAFVQRAIGYSLTGLTSEQVVFILHGSGSNGKSVLIETIAAVLADYVKRSPAETWVSKPNNGPSNDVAALAGARFVSVVETEHDKQLAEALVKQATGGDAMTARFHYKEFFSFVPKFKLWLATNHKPRIRGSDFAIWRRILLLPFNVTFNDKDKMTAGQKLKDPDLKNKLAGEFPGILAWMIRGCIAWQKVGLQPPEAVRTATESYQDSQDNVSGFIRDNCHLSRGVECSIGLLHVSYELWCSENEEAAASKRVFGKNLDERGYPAGARSDKARMRKGIDLNQECRAVAEKNMADAKGATNDQS